jgi:hypothetical protein
VARGYVRLNFVCPGSSIFPEIKPPFGSWQPRIEDDSTQNP